jgi:hypothetical protein
MTMKRFRLRKMDGPDFPVSFPRIPVERENNTLIHQKLKYSFLFNTLIIMKIGIWKVLFRIITFSEIRNILPTIK